MSHKPVENRLPDQTLGILGSYQISVAEILALLLVRQELHDVNRDVLACSEGSCVFTPGAESSGCSHVQDRNHDIAQMLGEFGGRVGGTAMHRA